MGSGRDELGCLRRDLLILWENNAAIIGKDPPLNQTFEFILSETNKLATGTAESGMTTESLRAYLNDVRKELPRGKLEDIGEDCGAVQVVPAQSTPDREQIDHETEMSTTDVRSLMASARMKYTPRFNGEPANRQLKFQRERRGHAIGLAGAMIIALEDTTGETAKVILSERFVSLSRPPLHAQVFDAFSYLIRTHPGLRFVGLSEFWHVAKQHVSLFVNSRAKMDELDCAVAFLALDVLNLASWKMPREVQMLTSGDRMFTNGCPFILRRLHAKVEANAGNHGPYVDLLENDTVRGKGLEGAGMLSSIVEGFTPTVCAGILREAPHLERLDRRGPRMVLDMVAGNIREQWYHDDAHSLVLARWAQAAVAAINEVDKKTANAAKALWHSIYQMCPRLPPSTVPIFRTLMGQLNQLAAAGGLEIRTGWGRVQH